jgi:CRISPR-associated protein (TIGR03986 family)
MEIETGKLVCITEGSKKKKRIVVKLECQNPKKTKVVRIDLKVDWLSAPLQLLFHQSLEQLNNLSVEFERSENNDPVRIWEVGQQWDGEASEPVEKAATPERVRPQEQPKQVRGDRFHNPYNFVPALPRDQVTGELGDRPPVGHGCYLSNYWSGRISVKLTTITPLLIPDASEITEEDGHKTYPVRLGADGKPYLPPTSIKGMLRSAYEAITNSRLSVFVQHNARLAYRIPATKGTTAKPARVERCANGLYLRILNESSCVGGAAKLPRYQKEGTPPDKGERTSASKYAGTNQLPQHGDRVRVQLGKGKVTRIEQWKSKNFPTDDWKLGWVCVTGANISGKQNERVFIQNPNDPVVRVDAQITELWENLIADYQDTHKKDLEERNRQGQSPSAYLGHQPGKTAWSRHVYDKDQLQFEEGVLCYVELSEDCDLTTIQPRDVLALQPVTISRRLYTQKPADLLPASLHPATNKKTLSPADRVFGWVNQNGRGSYKGHVRIHSVKCCTSKEKAVSYFATLGVPLAILGQPKPAQTRFYAATDKNGTPIQQGKNKEYGYENRERGLRGRKVYPHHGELPQDYWKNPWDDRTSQAMSGRYQEYRRSSNGIERDSQNRSITGWVNPGTEFTFDIDLTNLSTVELGALIWLLNLQENYYHRLGGGKPLGFGSVRLEVDCTECDLRTGKQWQEFYQSLRQVEKPNIQPLTQIDVYRQAVEQAYKKSFESVPFIAAFCRYAKGFEDGLPVHYPWNPEKKGEPDPQGENFKWFTENEQGDRLSLPSLVSGQSLAFNPRSTEKTSQGKSTPTISAALQRTKFTPK